MKTTTLFVLGLVLGALAVFGMRATSLGGNGETEAPGHEAPMEGHEGHEAPAESHEGHEAPMESHEGREGSGTLPPPDESEHAGHAEPSGAPDRLPENEICPVMGNAVDPEIYVDYKGRRIAFCCDGCDDVFLEDPETYLKKVDQELAAKAKAAASEDGASEDGGAAADEERLPENEICPVMGNAVDPEIYVDYKGRRIGFCCDGCDDVFLKDPETYLKKVDAELAKKRGEK